MFAVDLRTSTEYGVSFETLMENAGAAVARFVLRELPGANRVVVLCGKGNNGGDGLVAARHLGAAGREVTVLLLASIGDTKAEVRKMIDMLATPPVEITEAAQFETPRTDEICGNAEVFLDAVMGTGFKPPLRGLSVQARELLEKYPNTPVVSVDLPSGWNADAREFAQRGAYRSDAVVTFTAPKLAHVSGHLTQGGNLTRPGNLKQGPVVVAEIGSPEVAIKSTTGLTWAGASKRITDTPRNPDGNKGKFGHVLVIGGADGKAGAPAMASLAALRAGAGLVTAGIVASILPSVAGIAPELMTTPLLAGSNGAVSSRNLDPENLKHLVKKISVIAIGPGLGEDPDAQDFVIGMIEKTDLPMVIDADALNAIAQRKFPINGEGRVMVLTPHPGEMARLVNKTIAEVEADRENIARRYATEHNLTLVLKGWRTIIAHPGGRLAINTTGNPGLAKGGSGDILTGVVAALVAQYKEDVAAAVEAAVYLHGLAADFAVAAQDQHTLLATDVIAHLWRAFGFRAQDRAGYKWLQSFPGSMSV